MPGSGPSGPSHSGGLPKGLAALGIDPDSIDVVVISHLHADHTGGLLTDDGSRAFPKAAILSRPMRRALRLPIRC
jgi:metal-dependent hydrolase (beta-lactamase superfamily II)